MEQLRKLFAALMILSLVVSVFSSCKDDDDDSKEDRKAILTSKSWVMSSSKISPAIALNIPGFPSTLSDLADMMDDCDKDDYITFKADGTVETNDGAILCEDEDEDDGISKWEMNAEQTQIVLTQDGEKTTFTIVSITSSKIELSTPFSSTLFGADLTGMEAFITIADNTVMTIVFVAK